MRMSTRSGMWRIRGRFSGLQPFLGAGGGSIAFKPTTYGGQGLTTQARAVYYYNVGVEDYVYGDHVGLRAQFRQLVYLAPDFGQKLPDDYAAGAGHGAFGGVFSAVLGAVRGVGRPKAGVGGDA